MTYLMVAILLGAIALTVLGLALRLLIGRWLWQWLRGSAGLLLLGLAIVVALAAWDLRSYRPIAADKPIATLAFNRIDQRRYGVTLVDQGGSERRLELDGEMWQLDIHVLRWAAPLSQWIKSGYRPTRLSGRYLSLEDEQKLPRTAIDLGDDGAPLDVWSWLQRVNRHFSLLEALTTRASYLPMADGAMYSVAIERGSVVARPLNDRAKLAIERWQ